MEPLQLFFRIHGPWSRIGKRRGRSDVRFALTLCWILWVLTARPMVAIHENVVGFDTRIFEELLGKAFGIAQGLKDEAKYHGPALPD